MRKYLKQQKKTVSKDQLTVFLIYIYGIMISEYKYGYLICLLFLLLLF